MNIQFMKERRPRLQFEFACCYRVAFIITDCLNLINQSKVLQEVKNLYIFIGWLNESDQRMESDGRHVLYVHMYVWTNTQTSVKASSMPQSVT